MGYIEFVYRVTFKSLMNKSKAELAERHLQLLNENDDIREQLKKYRTALEKIAMDYHEDNPERHLNPVAPWQVAEKALERK